MYEDSSVVGYVDVYEVSENSILIEGWALSVSQKKPVDCIEIYFCNETITIKPLFIREDVKIVFNYEGCEYCGFKAVIPIALGEKPNVVVYGVSGSDKNRLIMNYG